MSRYYRDEDGSQTAEELVSSLLMQNDVREPQSGEIMNVEKFLYSFEGVEDVRDGAITEFLRIYPEILEDLSRSIHRQDFSAIEINAHTLKGMVSHFYASRCRAVAWIIEKRAQRQSFDQMAALLEILKLEMNRLAPLLRDWKELS